MRFRECCVDYQFRGESHSAAASPCGAFPPPLQGEGRGGDGVPQRRRDVTCSERKPIPTQTLPLKGRASKLRSEEHTSELQSLMRISYAVFCLKKKKKNTE